MKITPYKLVKGVRYIKHFGIKGFMVRLMERMEPQEVPYEQWYENDRPTQEQLKRQQKESDKWDICPFISIVVPTFNTDERMLREMVASVRQQSYQNWQLCIADGSTTDLVEAVMAELVGQDERISYKRLSENKGIAENTNEAFKMAGGEWIGLLDHDDTLALDALFAVAKRIREDDSIDVLYSDEDKMSEDSTEHFRPNFKPDFSPDLLNSNNYITHFLVVRTEIARQTGGFHSVYDGAQDHDFIFRCTEIAEKVEHIPRVLYHWRVSASSTADNPHSKQYAFEAGARAVADHLARTYPMLPQPEVTQALDTGFYKVKYPLAERPMISIIIPNKDEVDCLSRCLKSIARSSYENYEIILVENNSQKDETFGFYSGLLGRKITSEDARNASAPEWCETSLPGGQKLKLLFWREEFNYSAINNFGVNYAEGQYLVLLNNDVELITTDWMERMLGNCQRPDVGITGAKLYYKDHTIQHAGLVIGMGDHAGSVAGGVFTGMKRARSGYQHKAITQQNFSAVTAACLMVEKELYHTVGDFEERLTIAFNDVDFCLKVREAGYLVVFDPDVEGWHYESKSRGAENSEEKRRRFQGEIEYMRGKWITLLKAGDPYYNANLSLRKNDYSLRSNEK